MQLLDLTISNVLSFPPIPDFDNTGPSISFCEPSSKVGVYVLIGPNGSGKSNCAEIINQIFRNFLFKRVTFNADLFNRTLAKTATQASNGVLGFGQSVFQHLKPHFNFSVPEMKIRVRLSINQDDVANMIFLLDNKTELDNIIKNYATVPALLNIDRSKIKGGAVLDIVLTASGTENTFRFNVKDGTSETDFILNYLQHFNFYQKLIQIRNSYLKSKEAKEWPSLRQTFLLVGGYRNYSNFTEAITLSGNRDIVSSGALEQISNEATRTVINAEPAIFSYVKTRLAKDYHDAIELLDLKPSDALKKVKEKGYFAHINEALKQQLQLELLFSKAEQTYDNTFRLYFRNLISNKTAQVEDLSAGEKSLVHLIFTLFGFEIHNGLLVIDEPEIHLHPKMQELYANLLAKGSKLSQLQTIVITHSPHFSEIENVTGIRRFYKVDNCTKVASVKTLKINQTMLKLLEYAKASRAFFAEIVILVEGETDEMFFRFLLERIKAKHFDKLPWISKYDFVDIIQIGGKANVEPWRNLLKEFQVRTGFIGDCDYLNIVTKFKIEDLKEEYVAASKKADKDMKQIGSLDSTKLINAIRKIETENSAENIEALANLADEIIKRRIRYKKVLQNFRDKDPAKYGELTQQIQSAYKEGIYVLSKGDLEDYLNIDSKGLEAVFTFCSEKLDEWLEADSSKEERNEIFSILESFANTI